MSKTHCILLKIDDESLQWAKTHYPQFWDPSLGNKKRTSYLLSRALLLHTLKTYYHMTQLPEIIYHQHQKPAFKDCDITFNLTHSTHFVGLIISTEATSLGIDIETIIPRRNFEGLLKRTFSPLEIQWILKITDSQLATLMQADDPQRLLQTDEMIRFFLLWSAKEAYLKADGRGLQGLNSLHLNLQQSTMNGDLNNGSLLITTLTAYDTNETLSSLALYLPTNILSGISIQSLSITPCHQALYRPLSISWRYQLLEDNASSCKMTIPCIMQ